MKPVILLYAIITVLVCVSAADGSVIYVPGDEPTIQAGIDAAETGDTVLVFDGTYTGDGNRDIQFFGKSIVLKSVNGAENCIIDCQGSETDQHRGFIFESFETESAVLDGFTIQNAYWIQYEPYISAAAIQVINASPTIQNCILRNCFAHTGGGILLGISNSLLLNCKIMDNSAINYAGGLAISTLANPVVANCLITGNFANLGGGGITVGFDSRPIIFNCTITLNNTSRGHGGGLHIYNADPTVVNCILWDNPPEEIAYWGELPNIKYCDIQDGFPGQGNIDANPRFIQGLSGVYCLSQVAAGQAQDSPCVDAGNDLAELICCPFYQAVICMDEFSTRTDNVTDEAVVDMGYHYLITPPCVHHGDVNGSGDITSADGQQAFMIMLGAGSPTYEERCFADCNGNGIITSGDAQLIFMAALGVEDCADPLR